MQACGAFYEVLGFPFLLGRAFIEASTTYWCSAVNALIFLPNLEGLSLRTHALSETGVYYEIFSLSGETCIKAQRGHTNGEHRRWLFPYSFVGTFIEAKALHDAVETSRDISSLNCLPFLGHQN